MKKIIFICFALPFITFMGCGSKEQDAPMASVSEILTQGEWTSVTNLEDIDLDGTFVEFGDDCEKDDHFVFKTDLTFQQKTGATDCDGGVGVNAIAAEGDWSLEDADRTLVLHFFIEDAKFKIYSITDHEIKLGMIEDTNPIGVITQQIIFKR
jgi:hypothetical protein